jgi:hypothetical protein
MLKDNKFLFSYQQICWSEDEIFKNKIFLCEKHTKFIPNKRHLFIIKLKIDSNQTNLIEI